MCEGLGEHGILAWHLFPEKIGLNSRMDFHDKIFHALWIMMSWVCARQVLHIFFELFNVSGYMETQPGPASLFCTSAYQAHEVHCRVGGLEPEQAGKFSSARLHQLPCVLLLNSIWCTSMVPALHGWMDE